uniref:Uncharacterized protein n=1 Tax=Arundo donax TaxID=35708 RepID=A0A0A9GZ52_ARUDO
MELLLQKAMSTPPPSPPALVRRPRTPTLSAPPASALGASARSLSGMYQDGIFRSPCDVAAPALTGKLLILGSDCGHM